jgi:hypothetical protein
MIVPHPGGLDGQSAENHSDRERDALISAGRLKSCDGAFAASGGAAVLRLDPVPDGPLSNAVTLPSTATATSAAAALPDWEEEAAAPLSSATLILSISPGMTSRRAPAAL